MYGLVSLHMMSLAVKHMNKRRRWRPSCFRAGGLNLTALGYDVTKQTHP